MDDQKPLQVVAAVLFESGRILICQRSAQGEFPLQWEFPGGKIEPGEDPQTALRRELHEELGIVAEPGGAIASIAHQYPARRPVLLLFFAISRYQGDACNRVFEQIRWVKPEELLGYDFLEGDRSLIQRIAAGDLRIPETAPETPLPDN